MVGLQTDPSPHVSKYLPIGILTTQRGHHPGDQCEEYHQVTLTTPLRTLLARETQGALHLVWRLANDVKKPMNCKNL